MYRTPLTAYPNDFEKNMLPKLCGKSIFSQRG